MDGEAAVCLSQAVKRIRDASSDSSARQALHRHLISITQYLAARKIIPHPNGTIRCGCKELSACSSPRMQGGSSLCFNGLSRGNTEKQDAFTEHSSVQSMFLSAFPTQPGTAETAFMKGNVFFSRLIKNNSAV